MIPLVLLILAVGVAAVLLTSHATAGATEPAILADRERLYAPYVVSAARAQGVDPALALATAYHESRWRPSAVNKSARDGLRGGAWGLGQVTIRTVEGLGYRGPPESLLTAALGAEWLARVHADNLRRFRTGSVRDLAAAYNSGRDWAGLLKAIEDAEGRAATARGKGDTSGERAALDVVAALKGARDRYVPALLEAHARYARRADLLGGGAA